MQAICEDCEERLLNMGEPVLCVCERVCQDYADRGVTVLFDDYDGDICTVVKFLETKGYLISSEVAVNEVAIFPNKNTSYFNEDTRKFCWCPYFR